MNCNKAQRLLSRFVDKELHDKRLIEELQGHLSTCAHCSRELESLISMKDLCSQTTRLSEDPGFVWRIQDALAGLNSEKLRFPDLGWLFDTGAMARRLIPIPVAAAMLVTALLFMQLTEAPFADDIMPGTWIAVTGQQPDPFILYSEFLFHE